MSKTTNKFSPEVRTRAVRMVLEHGGGIRHAGLLWFRFPRRSAARPTP